MGDTRNGSPRLGKRARQRAAARARPDRKAKQLERLRADAVVDPVARFVASAGIDWTEDALSLGWVGRRTYVRRSTLLELAAEPPWPGLRVLWLVDEAPCSARFVPRYADDAEAIAARVASLFDHVAARWPSVARSRGWLDVPDIDWETAAWPIEEEPLRTHEQGAYRTSPAPGSAARVLAHRTRRTSLEALLHWLASRPGLEWRDQPLEVAVTESSVFVRRSDGVFCLPLAAITRVDGTPQTDLIVTFARRRRLILPFRPGCPVAALLLARAPLPPA